MQSDLGTVSKLTGNLPCVKQFKRSKAKVMPHTGTCHRYWKQLHLTEQQLKKPSYAEFGMSGINRTSLQALLACLYSQKTFGIAHKPDNLSETEDLPFLALSLVLSAELSMYTVNMSGHSR